MVKHGLKAGGFPAMRPVLWASAGLRWSRSWTGSSTAWQRAGGPSDCVLWGRDEGPCRLARLSLLRFGEVGWAPGWASALPWHDPSAHPAGKVAGVQADSFVVAKKRQGNLANTAAADSRAMAFTDVQVGASEGERWLEAHRGPGGWRQRVGWAAQRQPARQAGRQAGRQALSSDLWPPCLLAGQPEGRGRAAAGAGPGGGGGGGGRRRQRHGACCRRRRRRSGGVGGASGGRGVLLHQRRVERGAGAGAGQGAQGRGQGRRGPLGPGEAAAAAAELAWCWLAGVLRWGRRARTQPLGPGGFGGRVGGVCRQGAERLRAACALLHRRLAGAPPCPPMHPPPPCPSFSCQVAALVPGKTKAQCFKRFKELKDAHKAKKAG